MPHEYTRQRQGRDFALNNALTKAFDENRRKNENALKNDEERKSLWNKMKQLVEDAKRNTVPVDGDEPPEKRGITK